MAKKQKKREDLGIAAKLLYIFNKKQQKSFAGIAVLNIGMALLETGVVAMMLPFVNSVMEVNTIEDSVWRSVIYKIFQCKTPTDLIAAMALVLAGLYVVKGGARIFVTWIQSHFFARARTDLSGRLLDCILHKPYAYHLHHTLAETQRAVTGDVTQLFNVANAITTIFAEGLTGATLLALLFFVDPMLTLFACALILITLLVVNRVVAPAIRQAGEEAWLRNTEIMKWVNQAMGGLKGILANRRQQTFLNHYAENARGNAELESKNSILGTIPKVTVETISMAGIFGFMAVLVMRRQELESMLPLFSTFALAAVRIIPIANRINEALNVIRYNHIAVNSVYSILKESNVDTSAPLELIRDERPVITTESLRDGVRVSHVSFRFADAEENLYTDASIFIPAEKSVAFIGTTGSGKTTMADIILGLHKPSAGKVTADGHDIHTESDWWADRIGYIPQSIYLCDDTIRANVAFGMAAGDINDERVWKCLEHAQIKEFVESLPEGLNSVAGENGVRLSGGQRQRIGIARALYTDPPFLVMDEATSALDNDTERAIIESISALTGEKTLLIIAHRLTTVQSCDIIYRIENGIITVVRGAQLLNDME